MADRIRVAGSRPISTGRSQSNIRTPRRADSAHRRRFHPSTVSIYSVPFPRPPASRPQSHHLHRRIASLRLSNLDDLARVTDLLETQWEQHNINEYHRHLYREYVNRLETPLAVSVMIREIDDMKSGEAFIQRVMYAIDTRERSITELERFCKENEVMGREIVGQGAALLQTHRTITLVTIESIVRWRESILSLLVMSRTHRQGRALPFLWNDVNYMEKMMSDAEFLKQSKLGLRFKVGEPGDPLFLSAAIHREHLATLPLPEGLVARFSAAERTLLSEPWLALSTIYSTLSVAEINQMETICEEYVAETIRFLLPRLVQESFLDLEKLLRLQLRDLLSLDFFDFLTLEIAQETLRTLHNEKYDLHNSLISQEISQTYLHDWEERMSLEGCFEVVYQLFSEIEADFVLESVVKFAAIDEIAGKMAVEETAEEVLGMFYREISVEMMEENRLEAILRENEAKKQAEIELLMRKKAEMELETQRNEAKRLQKQLKMQEEEIQRLKETNLMTENEKLAAIKLAEEKRQKDLLEANFLHEKELQAAAERSQSELQQAEIRAQQAFQAAAEAKLREMQEIQAQQLQNAENKRLHDLKEAQIKQKIEIEELEKQRKAEIRRLEVQKYLETLENRVIDLRTLEKASKSDESMRETGFNSAFDTALDFKEAENTEEIVKLESCVEDIGEMMVEKACLEGIDGVVKGEVEEREGNLRVCREIVQEVADKMKYFDTNQPKIDDFFDILLIEILENEIKAIINAEKTEEIDEIAAFCGFISNKLCLKAIIEDEIRSICEFELTENIVDFLSSEFLFSEIKLSLLETEFQEIVQEIAFSSVEKVEKMQKLVSEEVVGSLVTGVILETSREVMEAETGRKCCEEVMERVVTEGFWEGWTREVVDVLEGVQREEVVHEVLEEWVRGMYRLEGERIAQEVQVSLFEDLIESFAADSTSDCLAELDPATYTFPFADSRSLHIIERMSGAAFTLHPLLITEESLLDVLTSYYRLLPSEILAYIESPCDQIQSMKTGNDPQWMWLMCNQQIIGLCGCIVEVTSMGAYRRVVCRHLSTLSWNLYPLAVEIIPSKWFLFDACVEFRVALVTSDSNLPQEISEIYRNLKFNYRSSQSTSTKTTTFMGKVRESKWTEGDMKPAGVDIHAKCRLSFSAAPVPPPHSLSCPEMTQISYRMGLLHLLNTLKCTVSSPPTTNLQVDLVENTSQVLHFPRDMTTSTAENTCQMVSFLQFPACESQQLDISGVWYQSFRFQSVDNVQSVLVGKKVGMKRVFMVNTADKNKFAVFVAWKGLKEEVEMEVETLKSDLHRKIWLLLQNTEYRDKPISDLWVPKFNLKKKAGLPWVESMEMKRESGEVGYVKTGSEEVRLVCGGVRRPEGQLHVRIVQGACLTTPFVFGVLEKVNGVLQPPLLVAYVSKEDWVGL